MRKLLALALCLVGCGPTIGDPCTVPKDCGVGVCLNRDFAPGGSCSLACEFGGPRCPMGSTCVSGAVDGQTPGCMLSCTTDKDCRAGYVCRREKDSLTPICVGPQGI